MAQVPDHFHRQPSRSTVDREALRTHNKMCDLEDALEEALDLLRWVTTEIDSLSVSETDNLLSTIRRLEEPLSPK